VAGSHYRDFFRHRFADPAVREAMTRLRAQLDARAMANGSRGWKPR
jgi:hypothetical protein